MSKNGTTTRYYFGSDNKVYIEQTNTRQIALSTEIIKDLAEQNAYVIRSPFEDVDYMAIGNRSIYLAKRLNHINLNTHYIPYEGDSQFYSNIEDLYPSITPVWTEREGAIKQELTWSPPSYMKLYFGVKLVTPRVDSQYAYVDSFMICKIGDELYIPPLPNIYSSGYICMGNEHVKPSRGTPIHNILKDTFEYFDESAWNNDLNENNRSRYIIFNKKGKPLHPSEETYLQRLQVVGSQDFKWGTAL